MPTAATWSTHLERIRRAMAGIDASDKAQATQAGQLAGVGVLPPEATQPTATPVQVQYGPSPASYADRIKEALVSGPAAPFTAQPLQSVFQQPAPAPGPATPAQAELAQPPQPQSYAERIYASRERHGMTREQHAAAKVKQIHIRQEQEAARKAAVEAEKEKAKWWKFTAGGKEYDLGQWPASQARQFKREALRTRLQQSIDELEGKREAAAKTVAHRRSLEKMEFGTTQDIRRAREVAKFDPVTRQLDRRLRANTAHTRSLINAGRLDLAERSEAARIDQQEKNRASREKIQGMIAARARGTAQATTLNRKASLYAKNAGRYEKRLSDLSREYNLLKEEERKLVVKGKKADQNRLTEVRRRVGEVNVDIDTAIGRITEAEGKLREIAEKLGVSVEPEPEPEPGVEGLMSTVEDVPGLGEPALDTETGMATVGEVGLDLGVPTTQPAPATVPGAMGGERGLAPSTLGQELTSDIARKYMVWANWDRQKAERQAEKDGWAWSRSQMAAPATQPAKTALDYLREVGGDRQKARQAMIQDRWGQ